MKKYKVVISVVMSEIDNDRFKLRISGAELKVEIQAMSEGDAILRVSAFAMHLCSSRMEFVSCTEIKER